jgi:hypothetical protein
VVTGIAIWLKCVTVNIIWKTIQSMWKRALLLEWNALQWNCIEDTSQQVVTVIAAWLKCVILNIRWKILHIKCSLIFLFEWSALQWKIYVSYFRAGGHSYCSLSDLRYSEQYMEGTSHHLDTDIASWMIYVTVDSIWQVINNGWPLILQLEWSASKLILYIK